MAALDDLIKQIDDANLREHIRQEVDKATKHKKFGLVFEEHIPECTPLYDMPVKKGSLVALKTGQVNEVYSVLQIKNGKAKCERQETHDIEEYAVEELVCVAKFGEPIYPYLKPVDSVCNAPDSDLWHTLIEADNYHALQLLEYLYGGKVDCIYIDPPYNTGAKDWKYNNNYVDSTDSYRHSKWLSFMQKRLKLAKKLLNPISSVLIVTIDEKEYLHLGCLLEEMFPEATIQMISSVINPAGVSRDGALFNKTNEFIFYVMLGDVTINHNFVTTNTKEVDWWYLHRRDYSSRRGTVKGGKSQFYPIYVNDKTLTIEKIGDAIPPEVDRFSVEQIEGCTAVFPIRDDGTEMNWGLTVPSLQELLNSNVVRVGKTRKKFMPYVIRYLSNDFQQKIDEGTWSVIGKRPDNSLIIIDNQQKIERVSTVWVNKIHNAKEYGTRILQSIIGGGKFSYPKSLYAVKDCLDYVIRTKKGALVIDFFGGSGTTLHAINLLNKEDGGKRRCIIVTNNEVSVNESESLSKRGFHPGDEEWEKLGIARYVTWPRNRCAVLGVNEDGKMLEGEYVTAVKKRVNRSRSIKQIVLNGMALDFNSRKSILSLLTDEKGKTRLPQKLLTKDTHYIINDENDTTIIFDLAYVDEWLEQLEANSQVSFIYVITDNNKVFQKLNTEIKEIMGPIVLEEPVTFPMAEGFKANLEYLRLGFLDKNAVALGRQFKEMLPTLWMKAGAVGKRPEIGEDIPDILVFPENKFAVLVEETEYREFCKVMDNHPEIETIYFITDSEMGYREMIAPFRNKDTYQLYRDYLDNFRINVRR